MAVPKKKVSKARRDKRRSNVWKLDAPTLVTCPNCGVEFRAYGKQERKFCCLECLRVAQHRGYR